LSLLGTVGGKKARRRSEGKGGVRSVCQHLKQIPGSSNFGSKQNEGEGSFGICQEKRGVRKGGGAHFGFIKKRKVYWDQRPGAEEGIGEVRKSD